MVSRRQSVKLGLSVALLSTAFAYFTINYYLPTNYFRDVFFYADAFVAHQILQTGFIPRAPAHPNLNYWGKIGTRINLPILPLFLVVIKTVTGAEIHHLYTLMPSFLVSAGGLYTLSKRTGLAVLPTIVLAVAGGLAATATVFYAISPAGLGRGIVFLTVGFLTLHLRREAHGRSLDDQILFGGALIAVMVGAFFWYPPHFIKIAGIVFISGVLVTASRRRFALSVSLSVIAVLIGLLVIEIPLGAYILYVQTAIVKAVHLNFGLPTGAQKVPYPTAYSPHYYSLLPLAILAPVAIVGGLRAVHEVVFKDARPVTLVAVGWGVAVLGISALYLATSSSFLVGRTYLLAFPVMIVGAALALGRSSVRVQTLLTVGVLVLVLSALFLQVGLSAIQIQSYEPGIADGSQWVGSHVDRNVITDTKRGAPMAADGQFDAVYPRTYDRVRAAFYTESYGRFDRAIDSPVVLSEGMTEYGLYVMTSKHKPISRSAYETRIRRSNVPYTNGEITLVIPRNGTAA